MVDTFEMFISSLRKFESKEDLPVSAPLSTELSSLLPSESTLLSKIITLQINFKDKIIYF